MDMNYHPLCRDRSWNNGMRCMFSIFWWVDKALSNVCYTDDLVTENIEPCIIVDNVCMCSHCDRYIICINNWTSNISSVYSTAWPGSYQRFRRWPVDSPHQEPVIQRTIPCHNFFYTIKSHHWNLSPKYKWPTNIPAVIKIKMYVMCRCVQKALGYFKTKSVLMFSQQLAGWKKPSFISFIAFAFSIQLNNIYNHHQF